MPEAPLQLARELVARGAQVVVVGGTARRLLGDPRRPRDLDVVVATADVDRLVRSWDAGDGSGLAASASQL